MRRDAADDDDAEVDDDRPAAKRARGSDAAAVARSDAIHREFEDRSRQLSFINQHHPERLASLLCGRREGAAAAVAGFVADLKSGSLSGPALKGHGLLRDLCVNDQHLSLLDLRPGVLMSAAEPCPQRSARSGARS